MKIVVIGSGLIGTTTAYCLNRRGHEVTVIERQAGAGRETSFANGALLTPSMPEPWNTPGCWRVLLGSIGRSDAPLQLRLRTVPALAGWGIKFLRNSSAALFERNTLSNLRLALYSLGAVQLLEQDARIEYGRAAVGSLRLFRDPGALDRACAVAERRMAEGLRYRRLSNAQVVELEPALEPIAGQLGGAIHYETDQTADAHRFCVALADEARRRGVEFRYGTAVAALELRAGRIAAVLSEQERFVADRYIVAAASYSAPMLRAIGVHLPVQPAKGYSVTFDCTREQSSLRIPVVDDDLHAAVVPLAGAIRVAGTAEFAGFDRTVDPERVRNLRALLQQVLPRAAIDPATARPWCGLRAMSTDGVPIIGPTAVPNLMVNTGHGHLGWTMAAGSAELLADLIEQAPPKLDPTPYSFTRFGS